MDLASEEKTSQPIEPESQINQKPHEEINETVKNSAPELQNLKAALTEKMGDVLASLEKVEEQEQELSFEENLMDAKRPNKTIESLTEDIDKLAEQLRKANSNIGKLKGANEMLNGKLRQQCFESIELWRLYDEEIKSKEILLQLYRENDDDYKAQTDELTNGIYELQNTHHEIIDKYETRLKECQLVHQTELNAKEELIVQLQQEMKDELKRLSEEMNERAIHFDKQQEEMEQIKTANRQLIADKNCLLVEKAVVYEELESRRLRSSHNNVEVSENEFPVVNTTILSQCDNYSARKSQTENFFLTEDLKQDNVTLESTIQELTAEKNVHLYNMTLSETRNDILKGKYSEQKKENEKYVTIVKDLRAENEILLTRLSTMQDQVGELESHHRTACCIKNDLMVEVETLKQELVHEKVVNKTLGCKFTSLKSKYLLCRKKIDLQLTIQRSSQCNPSAKSSDRKRTSNTATEEASSMAKKRQPAGIIDSSTENDDDTIIDVGDVNSGKCDLPDIKLLYLPAVETRKQTRFILDAFQCNKTDGRNRKHHQSFKRSRSVEMIPHSLRSQSVIDDHQHNESTICGGNSVPARFSSRRSHRLIGRQFIRCNVLPSTMNGNQQSDVEHQKGNVDRQQQSIVDRHDSAINRRRSQRLKDRQQLVILE